MKRFVGPGTGHGYALLAIGAVIHVLMHAETGVAYVIAFGLSVIGIGIVFGLKRPRDWRVGGPTTVPGAARSKGSR